MALTIGQKRLGACAGSVVCVGVLLIVICVPLSFDSLEPETMGLHYNGLEETVSDDGGKAFREGQYFLGLGHRFLKFPNTVQTIEFVDPPLHSRTSDGLGVYLVISFQYQLDPYTLLSLYKTLGYDYEDIFRRVSANALKVAATQYSASNFFSNRTTIGPLMELHLRNEFSTMNLNIKMPGFQLDSVKLPANFEGSIRETQMQLQQIAILQAEQNTKKVEWETEYMKTVQRVDVQLNRARAEGEKSVVDAKAKSEADLVAARTEAQSRLLEADAKAQSMVVAADATARGLVLEAEAVADALQVEGDANAQGVLLANDADVKQYNFTQYAQAKSFVSIFNALGNNEQKFIQFMELRALNNMSWSEWTINMNEKLTSPFDLLSA